MSGDDVGAVTAKEVALVAAKHDPNVRAGMMLLSAAKRNPFARKKVQRIQRRADAGDPKAVASLTTLRTAKAVQQSTANATKPRKQRLVLPGGKGPKATTVTVTATVTKDPFHHWKKGSG
ncbi:MAG TPA: hypothetical protein VNO55_01160 [Polyangia bacterium]|nr:hypothetical protein [Polyangia bacterium]